MGAVTIADAIVVDFRGNCGRADLVEDFHRINADAAVEQASEMIERGEAFYGEATILGTPYITGYQPIKDASGKVIGVYYVGYIRQ